MTHQRKRNGIPIVIYPLITTRDSRDNEHKIIDLDNPIHEKAWIMPGDGAKAEVVGQQKINTHRIGTRADLSGVDLNSRVKFMDAEWDIVSPPKPHYGVKRHTRHWSFDIRERP